MAETLAGLERDGRVAEPAYAQLLHEFEVLGGYTLDQRVETALTGLGFTRDEWAKPPTALSGGEQTRASLARLVIADPDLLLLDEPTNHLDLDALEWLEEHLRRRAGSLLVASHDRAFLDATVTRVWELRDRRLTAFRGDYSAYHRQRESSATRGPSRTSRPRPSRSLARRSWSSATGATASSARCTSTKRGSSALESERRDAPKQASQAGHPDRRSRRRRAVAQRRDRRPGRGPGRSATCRVVARWRRTARSPASPSSSRVRRSWPRSAASGSASSARTAPARRRCCGRSPATCRRSTARSRSGTPSRSATSPSCAARPSRGRPSSTR